MTDDQAPRGKNENKIFTITVELMFLNLTLLQLARKTLERAGIILYSFASCPETFVPYKKAYIDLLKMLQAHGGQENIELRGNTILFIPDSRSTDQFSNLPHPGRIQILLMPLNSNFSIQKTDSSISIRSTPLQKHSRTTGSSSSFCSKQGTGSLDFSESPAVAAAQPATMLREYLNLMCPQKPKIVTYDDST